MKKSDMRGASMAPTQCDPVCITCSDQGIAAEVIELIGDGSAVVRADGTDETISVELVDAAVGDIVLVHAKVAIGKVGPLP